VLINQSTTTLVARRAKHRGVVYQGVLRGEFGRASLTIGDGSSDGDPCGEPSIAAASCLGRTDPVVSSGNTWSFWGDFAESRGRTCRVSMPVYTSSMKATRAKLFQNGGSQAVRLPAECRFPRGEREVVVRRVGRRVILESVDEWPDQFLKCLGTLSGEIPRPKQVPITKLRDPFG
jgi:virulence-associated protein VagC